MIKPDVSAQPWLIGGAGRSGKTTLAEVLLAHSRSVAGFPLEGVFHVYLQRRFPFFRAQRARLLAEYANRPRYMDAERSKVEFPRDHIEADIESLAQQIPDRIDHPIKLFAWFLDRFAAEHGRTGWAVFDLLPELRYTTYRRLLPGAKLIVMRRAPQEAIAEAVFWRSYPEPPEDRRRRFQNMLFQWCLSQRVSDQLAARYPDDVHIFSFNALLAGDPDTRSGLAEKLAIEIDDINSAFAFSPPYRFDGERSFQGPDGATRDLLTDNELTQVSRALAGHYPRADLALLLRIAPHAPVLAQSLSNLLLHPRTMLTRYRNALRQRVTDLLAGLRLRFGVRA